MTTYRPIHPACVSVLAVLLAAVCGLAGEPKPVSFRREIAPVLRDQCLACHGPKKAEGDYRVDSYAALVTPGASDDAPIVQGEPAESELLRRLASDDESERMPLEGPPLPKDIVARFELWIKSGARYDGSDPAEPIVTIIPPPTYPPPPETYRRAVPALALAYVETAEGRRLISGGYRELLVWDAGTGKLVRRMRNAPPRVHAIAVSPDGTRVAVAGGEPGRLGEVRVMDVAKGAVLGTPLTAGDVVLSVHWAPGGQRIASAGSDGRVSLMSASQVIWSRNVHKDWATAVRFRQDGKQLVSVGLDRQAIVLQAEDGHEVQVFAGHKYPIWSVAFAPDGQTVLSGDEGGRILQWSPADGKQLAELRVSGAVYGLCAAEKLIYAASAGRRVTEIDPSTKKPTRTFAGLQGRAISVALGPAVKHLAVGSDRGELWVFALENGKPVLKWENKVQRDTPAP